MDESIITLINQRIEAIRPKLLDLSRRNPLISTSFSIRSNSHIRVVDEQPEFLFNTLKNSEKLRLASLPMSTLLDHPYCPDYAIRYSQSPKSPKGTFSNALCREVEYLMMQAVVYCV
mgnify:CR=1 FL=1